VGGERAAALEVGSLREGVAALVVAHDAAAPGVLEEAEAPDWSTGAQVGPSSQAAYISCQYNLSPWGYPASSRNLAGGAGYPEDSDESRIRPPRL
jgi:hypothetical protein